MTTHILAIIILAGVVAFIIGLVTGKLSKKKAHYDEMQLKIRGEGYKVAFYVTIIMLLIMACLGEMNISLGISLSACMFIICMIGILTFIVYCIVNDAYFMVGENAKGYMTLIMLVVVINASCVVMRLIDGTMFENGQFVFENGGANLLCTLLFGVVLVAVIVKRVLSKESGE